MALASMLRLYKDDLYCDLMETYGILEPETVAIPKLAVLAWGLRDNARIKMRIAGRRLTTEQTIMAGIYDRLTEWVWAHTDEARNGGTGKPKSILEVLEGSHQEQENGVQTYATGEDFDSAWARATGGG